MLWVDIQEPTTHIALLLTQNENKNVHKEDITSCCVAFFKTIHHNLYLFTFSTFFLYSIGSSGLSFHAVHAAHALRKHTHSFLFWLFIFIRSECKAVQLNIQHGV